MKTLAIELPYDEIAAFCRRNEIVRLEVFGSILRDDFGPESDIDFLVTYADGAGISLFDLVQNQIDLAELLDRKVDLIDKVGLSQSLNKRRSRHIQESAQNVFAA